MPKQNIKAKYTPTELFFIAKLLNDPALEKIRQEALTYSLSVSIQSPIPANQYFLAIRALKNTPRQNTGFNGGGLQTQLKYYKKQAEASARKTLNELGIQIPQQTVVTSSTLSHHSIFRFRNLAIVAGAATACAAIGLYMSI